VWACVGTGDGTHTKFAVSPNLHTHREHTKTAEPTKRLSGRLRSSRFEGEWLVLSVWTAKRDYSFRLSVDNEDLYRLQEAVEAEIERRYTENAEEHPHGV
jgi:hypothetical protein